MMEKIRNFFVVPEEIRTEFWQSTLKKNNLSLLAISILIAGMEAFNICRVLFWSRSGLGSVNNRIYFGMYCSLLLAAIIAMTLLHVWRNGPVNRRWTVQFVSVMFFLLWHTGLNTYDLMKNPDGEILVFITAFLGLAMFIQMPGLYSLLCYMLSYALFMVLAGPMLREGTRINLTFTAIVALAVSLTNFHHAVDMLLQTRELNLTNRRLQELLQRDPLTGLLTKAAFNDCAQLCLSSYRPDRHLLMMVLDMDKFKLINDQYGHPCGDYVLEEMGRILQEVFPNVKGLGRLGGDEFAVIMYSKNEDVGQQIDEINRLLSLLSWNGENLGARCCVGVCRLCREHVSYDELYKEADQALYAAKKQGKAQWHFSEIR